MAINSLQGPVAAYANFTTPPVDSTTTRNQNIEASQTTLNTETTTAAQSAFEVTITAEAQERINQEKIDQERINQERLETETASEQASEQAGLNQAQTTENQIDRNIQPEQGSSPIVNIVA